MRYTCYVTVFFLFALGITEGDSQSFYNKGSIVTVMPGTIFTAQDSLVNEGTFTNDGNLVMGGTWLNTGTYHAGAGEITFNSTTASGPQIINHNNQSFSKLTISGGGTKLILADITIEDEIVLLEGVVQAENDARVIIEDDAIVSGGSDVSHINAPVYQKPGGDKLYPLGDGATYLPVRLAAEGDSEALIGIEGFAVTGGALSRGPSLTAVSNKRYWVVDFDEGYSQQVFITLPVRDEHSLGNMDDVVVAASPGKGEDFISLGRSDVSGNLTNGFVKSERPVTQPLVALAANVNDGAVMVYNAISPNGDDKNEFLVIANIESYPDNRLTIFNRWGDKVFEITGYDNRDRVFRGQSNVGEEKNLTNGTYFYTLEGSKGLKQNGFIVVRN